VSAELNQELTRESDITYLPNSAIILATKIKDAEDDKATGDSYAAGTSTHKMD